MEGQMVNGLIEPMDEQIVGGQIVTDGTNG